MSFPNFHLFSIIWKYFIVSRQLLRLTLYFKKSATWFFLLLPPGEQHATYTPSAGSSYSLLHRLLSLMDLTSLAALQKVMYCDLCICMYSAGLLVSASSRNVNWLWHFAADFNPISHGMRPQPPPLSWQRKSNPSDNLSSLLGPVLNIQWDNAS